MGAATKVYWSAEPVADVPPGVTTVMSTVPADSAGATAVIFVADTTVNEVAAVLPHSDDLMALASAGIFALRCPDHAMTAELRRVAAALVA